MIALATIPLTCWLCAWLARPTKPFAGSEVQELVYRRLLGGQQRLIVLAVVMTGAMLLLVALLPHRINADMAALRSARADCAAQYSEVNPLFAPVPCHDLQAVGVNPARVCA